MVAMFDLQAVIQLLRETIAVYFYKRKLNIFNFMVYDATTKQGNFCGVAKRGACEIASCVFDFLKERYQGTKAIFYSDNCCGQNKNET
ncbi:hypothetical protein PR048_004689 [Dryococelus australis]|uniref:Uncharacterized protein n=1 Tax=Dryococelus australis TaxID=614101 RepID=A0ABQ9I651_9NEOP|nr:hypothetical protein PR048_004689 [Dryococelus australis]